MKDLQRPSADRDPLSPDLTQSEVEQATRDILASAGFELLPEFSEPQKRREASEGEKAEQGPMPSRVAPLALLLVAREKLARLFAAFPAYVSRSAERAKKRISPPKLALGAHEDETTLENVLTSISMRAPAKASRRLPLEKAFALLAALPKLVRIGGAVLLALLFAGIYLLIVRPGAHHRRPAVAHHHALRSGKAAPAHRTAHRAPALQPHRPIQTGASEERSEDAAIIRGVRQRISHFCGLQVSKVYRWKYREGYLFCYSRSDNRDTSTVLERGADGIFTLIGGSKGLMTYQEMTDTFLIDGAIARKLLE